MYKKVDTMYTFVQQYCMKVFSFLNKIEITDVLQFFGLSLLGTGLFFVFGFGWACIGAGVVCTLLGFFGQIGQKGK